MKIKPPCEDLEDGNRGVLADAKLTALLEDIVFLDVTPDVRLVVPLQKSVVC